jgi:hypothetical protein
MWIVGAVGLVVVLLAIERVRGELAWAAWEEAMRARGERLTVAELTPVAPTNRETRILNPSEAQALLAVRAPADAPGAMVRVAPGKARVTWAAEGWHEGEGSNSWARIESTLVDLRERLPAIRSALTNRTYFLHLDYGAGFEMLLPHLAAEKGAAQALKLAVLDALHRRQLAEAQENLAALTAILEDLRPQPLVISQLVRIACGALLQTAVWEAVQTEDWTDAQLAALQEAWERMEYLGPMADALRMERAMARPYYEGRYSLAKLLDMTQGVSGLTGSSRQSSGGGTFQEVLGPLFEKSAELHHLLRVAVWRLAWMRHDELNAGRTIQQWIDEARVASTQRQAPPPADGNGGDDETGPVRPFTGRNGYDRARFWLSSTTLPGLDRTLAKAAWGEAMRELTVAAIALKRYRLRHGEWPKRLDQLVPEFVNTVPSDWFSGGPLKYRRNADATFLLYSVGEDRKDDGGDSGEPSVRGPGRKGNDLVWLQPATREEVETFESGQTSRLRRYGIRPAFPRPVSTP